MKREFVSLSPQEALHVAIFVEERNAEIYRQFAEMFAEFRDPESLEIAEAFWDMAKEERQHGSRLQALYFERYGNRGCVVTEEDIRELIEVPNMENGEIFAITRMQASPAPRRKALEIALRAEESALRYYTRLAELTVDADLRAAYHEFANFERDHTLMLTRKMEEEGRITRDPDLA